ncbi:PTS transporter subunit IIC [uncultured Enorma sp.]|uniref:PTS galactitol transporter subunit IIC n=1 Tax=uncultured Enorma sp. TaxID=1714346 RepID=UPI002803BE4B|nr:PTS transporter subunit IIC [uncultured Enorma sp.]
MDVIIGFFNVIKDAGATIMMPIVIFLFSLCMGVKPGKAIRAGLFVGIGFVGLNAMINMMTGSLAPAVQAMVERYGLTLDAVDIGWVPSSAIAFASTIGAIIIPLGLVVNVIMLVTNTTQTIDIDIWNYWHFAFTGAMVQSLTGSLPMGVAAAALNMVIVLVIADRTAPGVEKYNGLPGVSIPMGFAAAFAPIAAAFNWVIDKIPGVRDISLDMETVQNKLGVLGEPALIGAVFGAVIAALAGYDLVAIGTAAITLSAALVLIPKMAAVLMEGLLPLSDATSAFIEKHFKNRGKIYVGLDSAVGIGHPVCLTCSLVLIPLSILLAVILPGNRVLPFADLSVMPHIFVLIIGITRGDYFRSLLIGGLTMIAMLYCGTSLVPLLMETAAVADPATYGNYVGAFSSICDGCNPLTWLMIQISNFQWIGIAILAVAGIALAFWNRKKITSAAHVEAEAAAE